MDMDESKTKIRAFLTRFIRGDNLGDGDDIFAMRLVNSLFASQLVMFIEKEFAVTVDSEDLDLANFKSIDAMSAFVVRKKAS